MKERVRVRVYSRTQATHALKEPKNPYTVGSRAGQAATCMEGRGGESWLRVKEEAARAHSTLQR